MSSPVDIASLFGKAPAAQRVECRIGFGKANFSNSLTSFASFVVEAPFVRKSAILPMYRVKGGFDSTFMVGDVKQFGSITICDAQHPEGTILLFQVSGSRSLGGRMVGIRDGVIFVKLRKDGPEWEIFGKLPTSQQNKLGDRTLLFKGRGDILSADDLAGEGLTPHGGYSAKFMEPEEIDECFIISKTRDEEVARPRVVEVVKDDGTVVRKEVAAAPQRRMMMRKGSRT